MWKRKRRRARSARPESLSTECDADDESTDSESPLKPSASGGQAGIGRRQLVLRNFDMEQGGSG